MMRFLLKRKKSTHSARRKIFRLIDTQRHEEAKQLIPEHFRHLPLSLCYASNLCPLLHFAVKHGACGIVEYLLDGGADIEMKDEIGFTPLFVAAREGQCIELLLEWRADVNARDSWGRTPLMYMARNGYRCQLLTKADVNARDNVCSSFLSFIYSLIAFSE